MIRFVDILILWCLIYSHIGILHILITHLLSKLNSQIFINMCNRMGELLWTAEPRFEPAWVP